MAGLTNFYTGNDFNQTEQILLSTDFYRDKWSDLRQHPTIENQKITFLRYQIEQNPSDNVYQGELIPLYRNKVELNQVLLPKFKQWFQSEERRVDVVAVTPGGGKTYTATQALVQCCQADENFVGVLAQNTNQRVSEEVESILEHFEFEASIIQGRNSEEGSSGYCRNFQLVDKFNQANLSASQYVCRSACQFREECEENGYLSQFNRNSQLYIAPYESAINWATYYGEPNVIVFDENPMRPAIIEQKLTFEDLSQYKQQMLTISDQDYTYATKFISVLEILLGRHNNEANKSKTKSKNKARNFHRGQQVRQSFSDCLQGFYGHQDLDSLYNDRISWREELVDCNQQMRINDSPALLVAKTVLDVFDALTTQPEHTEITLKKKKEKQTEDECCLQLNRFQTYIDQLPEQTHLLILDAYAGQNTFNPLLNPQEIQYHQYQIQTKWQKKIRIHRNTGKSQVRKMDDQEIENIFGKFFEEYKPQSLLVYSYKSEIEPYEDQAGRVKKIVERIKPDISIEYSWFHKDRGSNQYKDCDSVLIFGSTYPDIDELNSELNARYDDQISQDKDEKYNFYLDHRLKQGIIDQQHHEIKQCLYRVRPTDKPRTAYLICSKFEIEGLTIDLELPYSEWSGQAISAERRKDSRIYQDLVKGVVAKIGFYAINFQSNLERMEKIVKDQELTEKMEYLIHQSQYGKSFSPIKDKTKNDFDQIIKKLDLKESRVKIKEAGKRKSWVKIYCHDPNLINQEINLSSF